MRVRCWELAAVFVGLALGGTAHAQPIQFRFADSLGVYMNSFVIPAINGTVDIQLYLDDTGAASSFFTNATQVANLFTNRLRGAGIKVTSLSPNVARIPAFDPFNVPPGDPPAPNPNVITPPVFNFLSDPGTTTAAGVMTLQEQVLQGTGAAATSTGGNSSRVLLATLRFTGLSAGQTTLTMADNDLSNQNTALGSEASPATNGGAVLDPSTGAPIPGLYSLTATITVTGVPEPTSIALCGLGAAGFVVRLRRRRTMQSSECATAV